MRFLLMFLLIAVPGFLVTIYLENKYGTTPAETPLQYKVRKDQEREQDEKSRATQETLERIRQRP